MWKLKPTSAINVLFFYLQAYFRQGVALQYLGRHADALAAFASGLAQDPKSLQLLVGMVEAAMKSPLRGRPVGQWQQVHVHVSLRSLCRPVSLSTFCTPTWGWWIQAKTVKLIKTT